MSSDPTSPSSESDDTSESLDELAERYTVDRIGEQNTIPYFGVRSSDVWLIAGATFTAAVFAAVGGLGWGSLVVAFLTLILGLYLFYVTPVHTPISSWLANMWRYMKRPGVTYSAAADSGSGKRNEGGVANKTPFKPDERTEDLTGIRRAWVGDAAVLRRDGRLEGAIEIDAGNMDFAPAPEWRDLKELGQEFVNKHTHSELKLHISTQEFGLESLTGRLEQRLEDPEIQSRPTLAALLKEYRERRPRQMADEGLQQHRIFLMLTVNPREIEDSHTGESTPAEKTARLPLIGRLLGRVPGTEVGRSRTLSDLEQHNQMVEKLDKRLETIREELVRGEPKWSASRVSTIELFQLEAQFWNGHQVDDSAIDKTLREPAAATGREQAATDGGREQEP